MYVIELYIYLYYHDIALEIREVSQELFHIRFDSFYEDLAAILWNPHYVVLRFVYAVAAFGELHHAIL